MWNKSGNYHQHLSTALQADQLTAHLRWSMKLSKVFYCFPLPRFQSGWCYILLCRKICNENSDKEMTPYPPWFFLSKISSVSVGNVFPQRKLQRENIKKTDALSISKRNLVINFPTYSVALKFDFHSDGVVASYPREIWNNCCSWDRVKFSWFTLCKVDRLLSPAIPSSCKISAGRYKSVTPVIQFRIFKDSCCDPRRNG